MNESNLYLWDGQEMTGPFTKDQVIGKNERGEVSVGVLIAVAGSDSWIPLAEWLSRSSSEDVADASDVPVEVQVFSDVPQACSIRIEVRQNAGLWEEAIEQAFQNHGSTATETVADDPEPILGGIRNTHAAGEEIELPLDPAVREQEGDGIELTAHSLSILGENFYATAARSQSGRFVIGWNPDGFRLLDNRTVVARGNMKSLGPGIVTDDGVAVLARYVENFSSALLCIGPNGDKMFSKRGLGPVDDMVVTPEGNILICSTCDQKGNCILMFELPSGTRLRRVSLVHEGVIGKIRYDAVKQVVEVHYEKSGPVHHYALTGRFLDGPSWAKDRICYMNGYQLYEEAQERLKKHREGTVGGDIIDLLQKALQHSVSPLTRAKIHRRLGESLTANGETATAVNNLRQALKLDRNVGCAKLLKQLEESGK